MQVIIAVITILRIELVLGPSGFICSLLGLLVTATFTDVFQLARLLWNAKQEILPSDLEIQDSLVVATTVLAVVVFANFVGSGISDAVFWRSSSSGRKVTRLSPTALSHTSPGQVASMLAVDCFQISMSMFLFPTPLAGILCMPVLLWQLSIRVGTVPTLWCAAWFVLVFLLPFPASRLQKALWIRNVRARDERLKRMGDLLSSIRLVKMYAWEKPHRERVEEARGDEMTAMFFINLLDGIIDSLYSAISSVLIIIVFGTLSIVDPTRTLTPGMSFTCVYILSVTDIINTAAALFLRNRSQGDGMASAVLKDVSLIVEPGSLVGVVGFVGTGKSSLMAAILGDMHCLKGASNVVGRVGYVSQMPSVHNMTIRDNILYGEKMDKDRYEHVLSACQLTDDLNRLPAGDLTEVGEKGETLSGGQKQRLALARAAYNQCDIYLLDDPLSALDPNVGRKVFQKVVSNDGVLRNKTRILVTNQGDLLCHMDQLLLVHDNRVSVYFSVVDLLDDPRVPETIRLAFSASGGIRLTWALAKLSGFWAYLALLAFVGSGAMYAWQLIWIKEWMDALPGANLSEHTVWVRGLLAISVADVILRAIGSSMMAASARQLSQSLHSGMLSCVLSSPVSFFDATPRGRILNRFSMDLDAIDSRMYLSGKQCIQNSLLMLAKLVIIGMQAPTVLIVGVVAAVVLVVSTRVAVHASHGARFCESVRTSRVLQHLTETMDCLSTIRAFGVVDRFCDHFCHLVDRNMCAYSAFTGCFRFVRLVSSAAVLVIVLATVALAVLATTFTDGDHSPSAVGLTLSAALAIPISMMTLCIMLFSYLQTVVSFERTLEYTELSGEVSVPSLPTPPEGPWPSDGRIQFVNYSASYRPGVLPDVLKNVSFTIEAEEKVGVVGRTGAGKSSLVLALLRVINSSGGKIRIDGVDIARIPLHKLRSAVTVIPQDPSLIRGSLRDNLDPCVIYTDDEIWEAVRQAHLDEVVHKDPAGLLLETGDGGCNLSAGQRQLACLARAMLRKPRVLVLDEATSKMDGDTDRLIQGALRTAFRRCTVLTIAHRINTVLDYDKILVMGEGRVLEFGPVSELLANPHSVFRSLAQDAGVLRSTQDDDDSCTTQL
ncbi:ABC transporter, putative [Ixodes scapularis]|uniref:ABC transporter, putative n=1 Tax=Ixodes scapularis TaxID=6945 RepID=B7QCH0_IXOSC|nr:ABC transporter, putative [Ixodes scapularis]|eukprot:XP_002413234.1 ABC transporter, putative [Ixodes scapularis]